MNNVIRLPERPRQLSYDGGTAYLLEQLDSLRRMARDLGYVEAGHFVSVALEAVRQQSDPGDAP